MYQICCLCLLTCLYIQISSASIPLDTGWGPPKVRNRTDLTIIIDGPNVFHSYNEQNIKTVFACLPDESEGSSMDDFPQDLFTPDQLAHGAVVLHLLAAVYSFAAVGVVCEVYFLPSVDGICCALNLSKDVAAATFMAFATAAPEFFAVLVGTFVTENDIGIGAVVGSGMFNILGVATCGGLAAKKTIRLDWWPMYRDSLTYLVAVAGLIIVIWDRVVTVGESIALIVIFFGYFIIILFNQRLQRVARLLVMRWFGIRPSPVSDNTSTTSCNSLRTISSTVDSRTDSPFELSTFQVTSQLEDDEIREENLGGEPYTPCFSNTGRRSSTLSCPSVSSAADVQQPAADLLFDITSFDVQQQPPSQSYSQANTEELISDTADLLSLADTDSTAADATSVDSLFPSDGEEEGVHLFRWPDGSWIYKTYWTLMWPVSLLLFLTVPDCRRKRFAKFYPVTFFMCICWIGAVSYFSSWMITVIGVTLGLPDSVMGLTFLALGSSMPEAISCIILARQGIGGMGFSNGLSCNTLDICLAMGIPWFIKIVASSKEVVIQSHSLHINSFLLVAAIVSLLVINTLDRFKLNKKMGLQCLVAYLILMTLSILIELGIIVPQPDVPC